MKMQFALFLALASLIACTHIKIDTPVAYIQPSELIEDSGLSFGLNLKPVRELTITDDASARPPTLVNTNKINNQLAGDFSFGMSEDWQATVGLTDSLGPIARIQYQMLGSPRAKSTTGWSAALSADLIFDTSSKSGDQSGTFGAGGYNWKAQASMSSFGSGISVGYRMGHNMMVFAGTSFNSFSVRTSIDQDPGISNAGGKYKQDNKGHSRSTGLGFLVGSGSVRLVPVFQWSEYKIDQSDSIKGVWCGLSLVMGD